MPKFHSLGNDKSRHKYIIIYANTFIFKNGSMKVVFDTQPAQEDK